MSTIHTIDTHYLDQSEIAAAYLVIEGERAAFVDNNTNFAVPRLMAALEAQELSPEQVEYLIITHVHLDHAGGTSKLADACPNATVLAHPRAAPHVIDPSKLVASASAVYGEENFRKLYGTIEPVSEDRVRVMDDEETLRFGNRELRFLHTRGHANHHFCIADSASGAICAGDAFGIAYPRLQREGTFAFPSTSPTDFEPELARESVRRLVAEKPDRIYVTHFGAVIDIETAAGQLIKHLEDSGAHTMTAVGSARFVDPHTVELADGEQLRGENFILCVGGHPRRIEFPGSDLALTHSDTWTLNRRPRSLLIVGGAATGCQVASNFAAFGSAVTVLPRGRPIAAVERRR